MAIDPRMSVVSLEYINTLPFADEFVRKVSPSAACSLSIQEEGDSNVLSGLSHGAREKSLENFLTPRSFQGQNTSSIDRQDEFVCDSLEATSPPSYKSNRRSNILDMPRSIDQVEDDLPDDATEPNQEPLEDYNGIDATQVDRYGFYQSEERRSPDTGVYANGRSPASVRRKGTITRHSLKRASINLGLIASTDYLEPPKAGLSDVEKEVERAQKWTEMARRREDDSAFDFKMTPKLKKRVYKGIPECWRASAWSSLLSHPPSDLSDHHLRQQYYLLVASPCDYDSQIDLDVPRTISGHVLFRNRHAGGQRLLFRVLHAVSLQFPKAGYVQGMASVAAMCLCYYPEDQAFIILCRLWSQRSMAELYDPGFSTLMAALKELEVTMSRTAVGSHLIEIGCLPLAWATRWYLTIFHISVPFRTQLRIWDVFMLHSKKTEVARFAVLEATTMALLEGIESILLSSDFDEAMSILTRPVAVQDDDRLIKAIWKKLRP